MKVRLPAAWASVAAFLLTACTATPAEVVMSVTPSVEQTYVAVGASETVGFGSNDPVREAWPQLLFTGSLPRGTVYFNLGIPGATVENALEHQVPEAVRLQPHIVTVWLNVNDLIEGVEAPIYEQRLGELVRQLRRGGATTVLVANTPPLERLPAYLAYRACAAEAAAAKAAAEAAAAAAAAAARAAAAGRQSGRPGPGQPRAAHGLPVPGVASGHQPVRWCSLSPHSNASLPAPEQVISAVAAYNNAISRVTLAEGAVLVDLHAAGLEARDRGGEHDLVSKDGFHPSTTGHKLIAQAFAAAAADQKPTVGETTDAAERPQ